MLRVNNIHQLLTSNDNKEASVQVWKMNIKKKNWESFSYSGRDFWLS